MQFLKVIANGPHMISWGMRGDFLLKYTELLARQNVDNSTTPQLIIHIVSHSYLLNLKL